MVCNVCLSTVEMERVLLENHSIHGDDATNALASL